MIIILNEKAYAEDRLRNKDIGSNPYSTLQILSKYYYHVLGYRKKRIEKCLLDFIKISYPNYHSSAKTWMETIEKLSSRAGKYPLYEIDGVWITKSEIKKIDSIEIKELRQLAFTFLCLAKLGNLKNGKNKGWVNTDLKDVFQMAHLSATTKQKYHLTGKLGEIKLLEFPKQNGNLSNRVTFIDDNSEKVLFVSDFRELGYEYLRYKGENIIRCANCRILIKGNKNNTKRYCSDCSGYIPIKTKIVICADCGEEFEIKASSRRIRCDSCYETERKRINKENQYKWRNSINNTTSLKDETS